MRTPPGPVQEVRGRAAGSIPARVEGQAVDGQADGAGQHQRPQQPALPEVQQREHEDVETRRRARRRGRWYAERHPVQRPQDGLPLPGGRQPHHQRPGPAPPGAAAGPRRRASATCAASAPPMKSARSPSGRGRRPGGVSADHPDLGRPGERPGRPAAPGATFSTKRTRKRAPPATKRTTRAVRDGQERARRSRGSRTTGSRRRARSGAPRRGAGPGRAHQATARARAQTRSHPLTVLAARRAGRERGPGLRGARPPPPPARSSAPSRAAR